VAPTARAKTDEEDTGGSEMTCHFYEAVLTVLGVQWHRIQVLNAPELRRATLLRWLQVVKASIVHPTTL
jgi:hypothetical protein